MASTSLLFQEYHQPDIPSKVKVTILASEWGSSKGGLSTLNRELAIQLAKLPEVEITFFLPRCSEGEKNQALSQNVKVVEAVPHPGFEELDWLSFPPDDLQIDVVVGHGIKLGRQAQVIRKFKNCQWVQMVHTDPEELGMFKTYDKPISKGEEKHKTEVKLCEMADLVIGVGPKLSEAFRSYLRGFQEVRCVHDFTPGVFDEFVSAKQSHDEQKHRSVLVFGRGGDEDFELKGFDIAGRAISKLPDTRLVFAGAPDGKHEEVARKLSECGVPKRCLRVRGFVQSREELKRLFQEVDLVLMPSRTEGFGLTGLEALSAGRPVLVSRNSGFGEALCKVPFGSSFVIDSEDPEEWAAAIKEVWNKDRQGRLDEAETLRTSYGKKYNWAKQSRGLLDKMISIVHGTSDAKTELQQLVADTECVVEENVKSLKLDHCQAEQGVIPLEAGLQRSQSASQISREFAYCEADITFFAARHDEDTRQWLFKDFDKWFSDPGDSKAYVLLGDAGIGKSVIAGALTQRARNKGHLGAAYFCRHNDGTRNNPRYLVGTIARQLCDCNSEISTLVGGEDGVKMMLADSKLGVKELFTKLLEEPLGKCAPCQQRKLVIIDALDETEYESREDFLYVIKKALPRLPQWLLFFITSRPEDSVQSRLEKYKPCIRICAGDSGERGFYKQHEQDMQLFLQKEIDFSYISYSVEQVTKKCNGLFLYAYYIAKVLKESNSHRVSQQTDLFPGDIDEFFQENFQRVFDKVGGDLYRKLFGCIIAAPSPLPISFVSYVLNKEKSDLDEQEAIDAVSLFVVRTSEGTVTFLHNLIPVWLTDKRKAPRWLLIDKKVAVEYLRIVFIEILSTVVDETRATLPLRDEDLERFVMHFAVRFLCHHIDQKSLTDVFNWLINYRFLEKRIHSGRIEIYHVIEDFKLASSCLPAEETQQRNVLQEISLALESDFHVLVECPHLLRSCFRNTLDGVGEIISIPQVSAPSLEWNICNILSAKTLSHCNCFATTSDNKTLAGAKGRSLFFFDASTLEALGGPFEVSQDMIQRINCLEFSPDDKFVFFGRLDKWFSVGRGCVEDFHQFSENPGHHDWGRIVSNGQHIVVKRNHFSDLPETCQTKGCVEDLLSLWAVKEIDGGPDKEWTCSFRQLPEMVAGFSNMSIETSSLLRRLGINLMSCEVNATHGANYRSCYFCDRLKELKELTDPSKESSLAHVRQLIIKLYRWIFRYQVWNLETGRPLLQDVFNQCTQFNPFTYFCHVTSAFDKWGKDIGCAGVDQVMSVCNIAVVTAIDTFFRLRFDWSKRTYVRLSKREVEWMRECLEGLRSIKCTVTREWVFKETHEETLKQEDGKEEEENKLTEIVWQSVDFISEFELRDVRVMLEWGLIEMIKRMLKEVWRLKVDLPREVEWQLDKMIVRRLKELLNLKENLPGEWDLNEMVEKKLKEVCRLKEDLHGKEERLIEMLGRRLKGVLRCKEDLHEEEEKKLIEMLGRRLKEVWKLKEELHGDEEKKLIEMVEKGLKEVWKPKEKLHGEEEKKLIEMVEKRLKEVWKLEEELHGKEEKKLIEMVEKRLKEVWKFEEDLHGNEERLIEMPGKRLKEVCRLKEDLHGEEERLIEIVGRTVKEVWKLKEDLHEERLIEIVGRTVKEVWKLKKELLGKEKKKLIELVEKRLNGVWKLEEELHGEEEKKLIEMVERRLKGVWKLKEDMHGEEEKKLIEILGRRLEVVWKFKEELHREEEKNLIEMLERSLKEVWKVKEELHGKEEKSLIEMVERGLKEVWKVKEELHGKVKWKRMGLKEDLCQILDELFSGWWQLICKWTLQLDLELFCDSFKRDVFLNFPEGFLDLVGNGISHCLSPRKMWMVNSNEMGEIHLLRTGFQDQDSCNYSSEKQEYRITQTKYLTFTYDDLYVVFLSHEKFLHALSLQTGTIFTSVSGRNCCYFTREKRVGYLFRSGTEERAIFLTSLLNPCKFFPALPGQDGEVGEVGETTAAIFSSSDTGKSISSESLITSWRLVDHNLAFFFEPFSESSSVGSRSQIQNCVFSTDGKLLAFQKHTQIKQCLVEEFKKSQCVVFEAAFSFTDLCLTFSLDGVFLLFSIRENCSDQHFYVWNVKEKVLSKSFSSPCLFSIDSFCLSPDNRNLILCGDEYEIEIWEFSLYPCHLLKRICVERSFNPVKFSHCVVSQDTELLVCCLANVIFVHSLQVADIHSSKRVLRGHLGKIEFCKFLKRNRYLISYAVDGMVFLWDISESKAIGFARIAKGREKILCMAVSPDEDRAVCFISPSRVCVLHFCNLKCALPVDFFTAPRKGGISTAETNLLPFRQISSRANIQASVLENIQPGGLSNPDFEERFVLTQEDFFDSDESDESGNQDDFD